MFKKTVLFIALVALTYLLDVAVLAQTGDDKEPGNAAGTPRPIERDKGHSDERMDSIKEGLKKGKEIQMGAGEPEQEDVDGDGIPDDRDPIVVLDPGKPAEGKGKGDDSQEPVPTTPTTPTTPTGDDDPEYPEYGEQDEPYYPPYQYDYPTERPERDIEYPRERQYQEIKLNQYVVGIGISAGSQNALKEILKGLPDSLDMAYVIVQHPDSKHRAISAEELSGLTDMPIAEATGGTELVPNHIYVIPPDRIMSVSNKILETVPKEEAEMVNMPIDHFLASLATNYKSRAIGVILSGDTSDGAEGLKEIDKNSGITFIQDAETAKYKMMPLCAIASGVPSMVLAPKNIALELKEYGFKPLVVHETLAN